MDLHFDDEDMTTPYFGEAPPSLSGPEQPMLALSAASGGRSRLDYLAELGRMAARSGRYEDAWSYLQRVLQLQRGEDCSPNMVARTTCELAVVAIRRGEASIGRILLADAASLTPDIHPAVLHNLAWLARQEGSLDAAEALYNDALTLKIAASGWCQPTVAVSLGALGQLQILRGQPLAALRSLLPARHILELCSVAVSSPMAFTLMGMGRAYLQLHMHEHARAAFERALAVREAIPVPPEQLACTRYHLVLALWPLSPEDAVSVARTALTEYAAAPGARPEPMSRLERWLAAR